MYWSAILFLGTSAMFVLHALIEFAGLNHDLYGITALIATLLLATSIVSFDRAVSKLGIST